MEHSQKREAETVWENFLYHPASGGVISKRECLAG